MVDDSPDGPFDGGLQTERTLLAWRRTALAFALGSAAAMRLLATSAGRVVLVLGVLGLGFAASTYVLSARRYRHLGDRRQAGTPLPAAGSAAATMTAAVAVLGVVCAVYLVTRLTSG